MRQVDVKWEGIRDDMTDIGDHTDFLQNGSLRVSGQYNRRPGFGAKLTPNAAALLVRELGTDIVSVETDGGIRFTDQNTGTIVTGATGYGTSIPPAAVQAFGRVYITNTANSVKVAGSFLGSSVLSAPTGINGLGTFSTTTGSMTAGTHSVRYRYIDATNTRTSAVYELIAGYSVAILSITWQLLPSPDPFCTGIVVESTIASGSSFFVVATLSNVAQSYTLSVNDAAISAGAASVGASAVPGSIPTLKTVRNAGLTPPPGAPTASAAAGGNCDAGIHLVRYRYQDIPNNRLSNPSAAVAVTTTAANAQISVTVSASTDTFVTGIILEMTGAGASTFYRASSVVNTGGTYTINLSDSSLVLQPPSSQDGDTGHAPPPLYGIIEEHRQRLWLWDSVTNLLAWSQPGFPESFDTTANARIITLATGDTPTAMFSFLSDLYLCGQQSMRRLAFTNDPADGYVLPTLGNSGAYNAACVTKTGSNDTYGWGRDGMWRIGSMQPGKISYAISDTMLTLLDPSTESTRFVAYEPIEQSIYFCFQPVGGTSVTSAFVFHTQSEQWMYYTYRNPLKCACQSSRYLSRQALLIADANGYFWRVGVSVSDGAGTNIVTAGGGSTTTVVFGANTSTTGQYAFRVNTGESRLITVASGTQFTVSPAFGTTVTPGEIINVGSIDHLFRTSWYVASKLSNKERPQYLLLMVRPGTTMGTGRARLYRDFSSSPVGVTAGSSDTWPNGIQIVNGETFIRLDFDSGAADGYLAIPLQVEWARAMRVEIELDNAGSGVQFFDYQWAASDKWQDQPVVRE